jgi:predicted XRE-type DNA-binding protein
MMELRNYIEKQGLTQAQAANLLGGTEPRVSEISEKIELFSLDALLHMASAAGRSPLVAIGS